MTRLTDTEARMAGLKQAINSCTVIERGMGKQTSVARASGVLEGAAAYLAMAVGPHQAYEIAQRAADAIATQLIAKNEG